MRDPIVARFWSRHPRNVDEARYACFASSSQSIQLRSLINVKLLAANHSDKPVHPTHNILHARFNVAENRSEEAIALTLNSPWTIRKRLVLPDVPRRG